MSALDNVFKLFFYSVCDIAKWIFAVKMASGIIKHAESADIQSIMKDLITGGFAYGSLYAIISILDAVKAQF